MRPIFGMKSKDIVCTNYGPIEWDPENDCVLNDPDGEKTKLLAKALAEKGMTYPDPWIWKDAEMANHIKDLKESGQWTEPLPPSEPVPPDAGPPPGHDVLLDHENRIRALEGEEPLTMEAFLTKHRFV